MTTTTTKTHTPAATTRKKNIIGGASSERQSRSSSSGSSSTTTSGLFRNTNAGITNTNAFFSSLWKLTGHPYYNQRWGRSMMGGSLQGKRDDHNDDVDDWDPESYEQALMHNQRRTDVRILLTQRALQSFIYVLLSFRDPHTVKWLEKTYDFANMESYHGTGAFNLTRFSTWDALLLDLVERPNDVVVVSARRRGRGHGGWSSENPSLEAKRYVEYEIDIEPVSLVSRMVSIRQQIAQEWTADLQTLVAVNELILESYHDTQTQQRLKDSNANKKENEEDDSDGIFPSQNSNVGGSGENENMDGASPFTAETSSGSSGDEFGESSSGGGRRHPFERPRSRQAYESMATVFLTNTMMEHESRTGRPSSAQRRGNFDLLSLLATQEAVHVVLRQYLAQGDERRVSLQWLRQFYKDRLSSHFDGDGPYGRADDFLQDLLLAPPTAKQNSGVLELVDSLRIAEDVIQARSAVALEWKEIMEQVVPSDHMELQKAILAVRMNGGPTTTQQSQQPQEITSTSTGSATVQQEPSQATVEASSRIMGEFE